jgi:hypothetical protein
MARITSPTGEQMQDTDNAGLLAYYERRGYTVERDTVPEPDGDGGGVEVPDGAPTSDWTVAQLKAWAKEHDVDLAGASRKDDIVAVLTDPDTAKTATPGEPLPEVSNDTGSGAD